MLLILIYPMKNIARKLALQLIDPDAVASEE